MKDVGDSKDHQLTVALRIRPVSDAEQDEAAAIVAHRLDEQYSPTMRATYLSMNEEQRRQTGNDFQA